MTIPIRNTVYEKIKESNSIIDVDLFKSLVKDDLQINEAKFNKILLDLEILGLITVSWITKDERRIEVIVEKNEVDDVEKQNQDMMEKDYEASFPGYEN
ncbi:MAG: hypothetical protein ACW9WZ_00675 [Nitrosopumilus sp.]